MNVPVHRAALPKPLALMLAVASLIMPTGIGLAAAGSARAAAPHVPPRLFLITASGKEVVDWTFHWATGNVPCSSGPATTSWHGSGSQTTTFKWIRQRVIISVFQPGNYNLSYVRPHQVTGSHEALGRTTNTITPKSCAPASTYSRKDCGKVLRLSAPYQFLDTGLGHWTIFMVPDLNYPTATQCPFGTSEQAVLIDNFVRVRGREIPSMLFFVRPAKLLRLPRGKSLTFSDVVTFPKESQGWEKNLCTAILNDPLSGGGGSGACHVDGTLRWKITLTRIR